MGYIGDYTPAEEKQLKEIDNKYEALSREFTDKYNNMSKQIHEIKNKAKEENRPLTPEESAFCNKQNLIDINKQHINILKEWDAEKDKINEKAKKRADFLFTQGTEKSLILIKNEVPKMILLHGMLAKRPELLESEKGDNNDTTPVWNAGYIDNLYDKFFSDDALREIINNAFYPYLKYLKESSDDAYKWACDFIEECVKGKNNIYNLIPDKELPSYNTTIPTLWKSPISKVADKLFKGDLYGELYYDVITSSEKSKTEFITMVCCDYADESIQILGNKKLEEFDRNVHDAIVTLYVGGNNDVITPQMIQANMAFNNPHFSDIHLEDIRNSLNKLMYTPMRVDLTRENPKEYKNKGFNLFYEGPIIAAEKLTMVKINGSAVAEAYHILREPFIYSYSAMKNQIISVKPKRFNIPLNKNKDVINLTNYLIRRIEVIKRNKGKGGISPNIRYDTIFETLGISASTPNALKKKKSTVRKNIRTILDEWVTTKYIKGYEENKKGHTIESIKIIV